MTRRNNVESPREKGPSFRYVKDRWVLRVKACAPRRATRKARSCRNSAHHSPCECDALSESPAQSGLHKVESRSWAYRRGWSDCPWVESSADLSAKRAVGCKGAETHGRCGG